MDAFISYRRDTGGIYANQIYKFLTQRCNMEVFYDIEALHGLAGKFPEKLRSAIEDADNFILLFTDFDIEGVVAESYYVQEIEHALKYGKRIIVLHGNNFSYPDILPESIEQIRQWQAIKINDVTYFTGAFWADLLAKMEPSEKRNIAYNRLVSFSKLESRDSIESRLPLTERLNSDVISIQMCAIACGGLLSQRDILDMLVKNQCKLQFIINHPSSPAAEDACTKRIGGGRQITSRQRAITRAYEDLREWQSDYPELIEGRTTNEFLPFAIFIIRTKHPENDTVKIDYYSFDNTSDQKRRSILISSADEENFDFYVHQFEWLWEHSDHLPLEEE